MADKTGIEWTDATWNPLRGCSRVSAGCQHCYAETVAARFSGTGQPYEGLIHPTTRGWNGQIKLLPEALQIPWRWTRGRRIFVNSMSDLFHPAVPFEFIAAVFWVMSVTTRHTYQVLTKRPERMLEFFQWLVRYQKSPDLDFLYEVDGFANDCVRWGMCDSIYAAAHTIPAIPAMGWAPCHGGRGGYDNCGPGWPYANVWLGVSVEDQATADERIPLLLKCPAAVRWISAEPLLGEINFRWVPYAQEAAGESYRQYLERNGSVNELEALRRLDWVVVGGESGTHARPMHPEWARSLRDQSKAAGVPFLFKQWGSWRPISDPGDWHEAHYRSNRRARGDESQAAFDDLYGRTCTVDTAVLQVDANHCSPDVPNAWRKDAVLGFNVGKKAAGRSLDGQLHDDYPVKP